jgi:hypothetical protein
MDVVLVVIRRRRPSGLASHQHRHHHHEADEPSNLSHRVASIVLDCSAEMKRGDRADIRQLPLPLRGMAIAVVGQNPRD